MIDLPPHSVECIAQAVYSEARGESEKGQRAVAHVILNRAKHKSFPKEPCAVVKQKSQFTYKRGSGPLWDKIVRVVRNVGSDPTGGALYFKNYGGGDSWGKKLVAKIGRHFFYR